MKKTQEVIELEFSVRMMAGSITYLKSVLKRHKNFLKQLTDDDENMNSVIFTRINNFLHEEQSSPHNIQAMEMVDLSLNLVNIIKEAESITERDILKEFIRNAANIMTEE